MHACKFFGGCKMSVRFSLPHLLVNLVSASVLSPHVRACWRESLAGVVSGFGFGWSCLRFDLPVQGSGICIILRANVVPFLSSSSCNKHTSMPLVDPITMASAVSKKGAASQTVTVESSASPTAETYNLLPVSINQTPLAQTLRHAQPLLLSGVLAFGFSSLVKDPVAAMSSTTLPLTAALQAVYAVICLPVAGRGGNDTAKKAKPRPGEKTSKKRAKEGGNNAYVVCCYACRFVARNQVLTTSRDTARRPLAPHHCSRYSVHLRLHGSFRCAFPHPRVSYASLRRPLVSAGTLPALLRSWCRC